LSPSADLAEKLLYFQWLGYQTDVPLEDLHLHAWHPPVDS
jgi:hypothetical protein